MTRAPAAAALLAAALLAATALVASAGCGDDGASCVPPTPTGDRAVWGEAYAGDDPELPYFPDGRATYWRYAFEPPEGQGLRLQGELAHARYTGLDLYDDEARTSLASLRDTAMTPDACSRNPFAEGADTGDAPRTFTVHLVPEGAEAGLANAMTWPAGTGRLGVVLRVYVPDPAATAATGLVGGVPLPAVEAFDLATGEARPAPAPVPPPAPPLAVLEALVEQSFPPAPAGEIAFFRPPLGDLYATAENRYLGAVTDRAPSEVALVEVRPPSRAEDLAGIATADVRYWSFNLGTTATFTTETLADEDATLTPEGTVRLVVGDVDVVLGNAAARDKASVLPWSAGDGPLVLVYRNLATRPGYPFSLDRVPVADPDGDVEALRAEATLGDRAPRGVLCSRSAYLDGLCGFDRLAVAP